MLILVNFTTQMKPCILYTGNCGAQRKQNLRKETLNLYKHSPQLLQPPSRLHLVSLTVLGEAVLSVTSLNGSVRLC